MKIYRPDLSVRLCPRVPIRLRRAVVQVSRTNDMPEADVLRYSFEAVVLLIDAGKLRFQQTPRIHLEAMAMVRTSKSIARKTRVILSRLKAKGEQPVKPHHPQQTEVEHADVLRSLIVMGVTLAGQKGMAHVMELREKMLR